MRTVAQGTEQNDWDLASSEQLEVNTSATSYTLLSDALVKIAVQLGNAANLLHASGGILAVTVKVTPVDTGDKCVMAQKQMNLEAGDQLAFISLESFWAEKDSIIEVHAKSTNAGDISVGGKVWIGDITPSGGSTPAQFVTALLAKTGWTEGGTMTIETLMKLLAAWVAGTWQSKSGSTTVKELLDADDDSTSVLEHTLSATTPYRESTVQ